MTFHRDDQPADVRALGLRLPVVVAETSDGELFEIADADVLEACAGDPERLLEHIERRLAD